MAIVVLPATSPCKGRRVESKKPCDANRDALSYCKYHSPLGLQCRGIASKTTGKRCRIKWNLNGDLLCPFHRDQSVQCHGVSASGERCESTEQLNKHGFCPAHPSRAEDLLREFARVALGEDKPETSTVVMKTNSVTVTVTVDGEEAV